MRKLLAFFSSLFGIERHQRYENVRKARCTECIEEIDLNKKVPLLFGVHEFRDAFACKKCGRLHWESGEGAFDRNGNKLKFVNFFVVTIPNRSLR